MAVDLKIESMEIISTVINECGSKLRKEDPTRLVRFIKQLHDNSQGAAESSNRMNVLLEEVYALKNNKIQNTSVDDRVKRLWKTLRFVINSTGLDLLALRLTWDDLVNADQCGRWWVVGGVWKGQEEALKRSKEQDLVKSEHALNCGGGAIAQAIVRAPKELVKIAKKQKMSTDIRRAIFFEMMDADGVIDAFCKLMALNLSERQQREIVYVLICCCGASKNYNSFFALLASYICKQRSAFKFTFQLAYFDIIREADSYLLRKLSNLARMLSHLVLQQDLTLSTLKVVDFSNINGHTHHFLNELFEEFLSYGGDGKEGSRVIARAVNRLGVAKDFTSLADGIQLFFRQGFSFAHESNLLEKRITMTRRILEALTITHISSAEPDFFDEAMS